MLSRNTPNVKGFEDVPDLIPPVSGNAELSSLDDILLGLSSVETDKAAVRTFATSIVEDAARLTDIDLLRLKNALFEHSATKSFIDSEWMPIVSRLQVAQLEGEPEEGGSNADPLAELPDVDDANLNRYEASDYGNAEAVYRLYGNRLLYCESFGWLYNGGSHWERSVGEKMAVKAVTKVLRMRCKNALATGKSDIAKASAPSARHIKDALYLLRNFVTVAADEFISSPHLLNCSNGVVDLRTGNLRKHETTDRFLYCVTTDYKRSADSELWKRVLSESLGGKPDVVEYMHRSLGYSITGETREECMFYLYGKPRSGKGTVMNTVHGVLGINLARGVKFDLFTKNDGDPQNFRLAPLHNMRFVTAAESKRSERLNDSVVKVLTGRDPITASFKGKDSFDYVPEFKLWLSSNHPIKGDADDDAFWGRFKVFHFTNSHLGSEDVTIKDKLMEQGNREGVLSWLVAGAVKWYKLGLRNTPPVMREDLEKQRNNQDYVKMWIDYWFYEKPGKELSIDELYESYEEWRQLHGFDKNGLSKIALGRALNAKGYESREQRERKEGKRISITYYSGLAWKSDVDDFVDGDEVKVDGDDDWE